MAKMDKAMDRVKKVLSGASEPETKPADAAHKSSKKKLRTREMHIKRGSKSGYIARHDMEDETGEHAPSEEHPIQSLKDLQAHLAEHMQGEGEGQQPELAAEDTA
jgi:hypothetical protein